MTTEARDMLAAEIIARAVEEALARHGVDVARAEGTLDDAADAIAALEAEGMVVVPLEPTEAMIAAPADRRDGLDLYAWLEAVAETGEQPEIDPAAFVTLVTMGARSLLTRQALTDEAMVLVPRDPTEAMIEAGEEARIDNTDRYLDGSEVARDVVPPIYQAMLASRPGATDLPDQFGLPTIGGRE
jgi:hypothetical protein